MALALIIDSEARGELRVLIDPADLSLIEGYSWSVNAGGYVIARDKANGGYVYLHRLIVPGAKMIDHANGDKLDNRRSNLRPATPTQNAANSAKRPGTSSKFKGVTWHRGNGSWWSQIQAEGRKRSLGYYRDEADAARAYDQAALELFGEFARLNFPASIGQVAA